MKKFIYSLVGVLIVAAAGFGYVYYQLQPAHHFKLAPVLSDGKTVPKLSADSLNLLVMGSDARPGEKIGHSDTMMLMHVDLKNNQVNAVSIPRDTRVHLDGYGYTKLTSVQYILQAKNGPKKGIEGAVKAISDFTGVPINYYVETNFEGLQKMIDAVGGIEMNVPAAEKTDAGVIPSGKQLLDGKTVLALSRERHSVAGGDYTRQQMQLEALKGIAKAALKPGNISKLPSLVNTASQYIVATNMSDTDMVSLGLAVKNIDPNKQLQYQQLKGTGKRMYDDVLRAHNSQIVINPAEMKTTIQKYF